MCVIFYVFLVFFRPGEGGAAKAQSPTPSLDPSEAGDECMVCSDAGREIVFGPCGHCVTCEHCGSRVKKCLLCRAPVVSRSKVRGNVEAVRGENYDKFIYSFLTGRVRCSWRWAVVGKMSVMFFSLLVFRLRNAWCVRIRKRVLYSSRVATSVLALTALAL